MIYQETLQAKENPSEINVSSSIYKHVINDSSNEKYPRHLHLFYEMVHFIDVFEPYGKFIFDQNEFSVRNNMLILVPPLSVHGFSGIRSRSNLQVQFTGKFLHKNASTYFNKQMLRISGEIQSSGFLLLENDPILKRILEEMVRITPTFVTPMRQESHVIQYTVTYEFKLNALVLQLVSRLLETNNLRAVEGGIFDKNANALYHVMNRIVTHPEEKLSMEDAAKMTCMSYYSFSRFFLEIIGYNYVDFCNQMRIHRAQELLADSNINSTELANHLNFGSASYFDRVFRRFAGCSPSEYRNRLLRN